MRAISSLASMDRSGTNGSGSYGIAHSEPEAIAGPSLEAILGRMEDKEALPFTKQLTQKLRTPS